MTKIRGDGSGVLAVMVHNAASLHQFGQGEPALPQLWTTEADKFVTKRDEWRYFVVLKVGTALA